MRAIEWQRNLLAVGVLLAAGYWVGNVRQVHAAGYSTASEVQFQLTGVNENSSLLVYQPGNKTVYVYRGATVGNATVQCSFKYVLGEPGGAVGSAFH